jgi:hypothetical protein
VRLFAHKIGAIPEEVLERLSALTAAQALAMGEALLDFGSLADLTAARLSSPKTWLAAQEA